MTASATVVRPRRPEDLPACVEVLLAVHDVDAYPVNWPADPAAWLDAGGSLAAWVAELDGAVVGHAVLRPAVAGTSAQAWSRAAGVPVDALGVVSRLVVSPATRGRGTGAALLRAVAATAVELGLTPVLDVVATDQRARALYQRQGWTHVETLQEQWGTTAVTIHLYVLPET